MAAQNPAKSSTTSAVAAAAPPSAAASSVARNATAAKIGAALGAAAVRKPAPAPANPAARSGAHALAANGQATAFSANDVERVYSQYVAARKQNAERTDNVKLDTIEKTIRGMLPQLEKKHVGKTIDFEVVVKDGKVALKPVAK
jgi:hypothetical protein